MGSKKLAHIFWGARHGEVQRRYRRLPCRIADVLNESLDLVDYKARQVGVTIKRQTEVCGDMTIVTDHNRFRLILVNLLSNAIKFNHPQGEVIISCEQRGTGLSISIQDNGMGIPAAMHHRMFNPFDRLGREGGNIDGVGIGLAIAKRSVESLGGTIDFESIEGQGSTFRVALG